MKIQLFVPPQGYVAQRWTEGTSMPPLGILSLAAVLEKLDVELEVVPADVLGLTWKDLEEKIRSFGPRLVGVTTTTENRFDSFKLAQIAKKVNPEIITVLGGPHVTMARADTLRHIPDVDIAVIGEGEITLAELVKTIQKGGNLSSVSGIYFRREGEIIFTGFRRPIDNLDSLPVPARHLVPMDRYNFYVPIPGGSRLKAQNIMTSRGCPFNCYFCATPINWGRKMRGHSPERVVDEIEYLLENQGAEYIWFYDDTLNYHPVRLNRIMDMVLERGLKFKFCNEFRIDIIEKSLLEKMVKAGLVWGHFGIEAGSERVRKEIVGKNFDIEKAYQFVRWAKELGFVPDAFLIFSHYTETWDEALETIRVMERLKDINPETEFATALLHVYPGTPLEKIARAEGIIPKDFSWSRKIDLKRVRLLPAAQGHVPLFKHRLSWYQIGDLVMRGTGSEKKSLSGAKIKDALRTLSSIKDLWVYFVFFLNWIKYRVKRSAK